MKKLIPTLVLFCMLTSSHAQVERDKALHFLGGNLFGLAGAGIAKQASDGNRVWTFVGSVMGSTLIGIAKESVDAGQSDNGWDNDDLAATILGGVTVGVTIELFSKKKKKRLPADSYTVQKIDLEALENSSKLVWDFAQKNELPVLTPLGFSDDIASVEFQE